ncbi:MAG: RdgB/HAM1 family non-canonical purine NTP pyrophosphatase, partial [bacterium]
MKTIFVASRNRGKIAEYEALFAACGFRVDSLADHPEIAEVAETGTSFVANAILKATAAVNVFGTLAVGDDSGLEVDALAGAPGVRSQRYSVAGTAEANNQKLLDTLAGVMNRQARFVCTIVVMKPTGEYRTYRGTLTGVIAEQPCGTGGFGYDPLFYLPELGQTVAQLDSNNKNAIS